MPLNEWPVARFSNARRPIGKWRQHGHMTVRNLAPSALSEAILAALMSRAKRSKPTTVDSMLTVRYRF
jgi:hypothetical protein